MTPSVAFVIKGRSYKKTTAEEDDLLRQRLADVVDKIQFARPAAAAPSPAAPARTPTEPAK